jgi:hypothetical protein
VANEFVPVKLGFKVGSLTPTEIQGILDEITAELSKPNSQASRDAAEIGVSVESLEVQEHPAFVVEAFLIAMAVKFAGGAAGAGGALFFNRVIKPRISRKRGDGIGDPIEPDETDNDD